MSPDVDAYLAILDQQEGTPPEVDITAMSPADAGDGRRFNAPVDRHLGCKGVPTVPFANRTDPANCPLFNEQELPESFAGVYKKERVEHRIIAYFRSQGYSGVEIASMTGYSKGSIYAILRLPWVKEVVMDELRKRQDSAVQEVLRGRALDHVLFLDETVHDEKQQTRDRITAAKEFLDRAYGKPNQPVTHREEVDLSTLPDDKLAEIAMRVAVN